MQLALTVSSILNIVLFTFWRIEREKNKSNNEDDGFIGGYK